MFETNPETCFVHSLCPPTSTPLSPTIISICSCFNVNLLNFSRHNKTCLKHASCTTSVRPYLPPFPPRSSPSAAFCSPSTPFFLARNEACLKLILKYISYTIPQSTHIYPPFPHDHLHLQLLQPQFAEYLTPKRSMFETNPETCFVYGLCPPTSNPLCPRSSPSAAPSTSIACLRLTLKYVSFTASVHPQLPPFPPRSSPSAAPSTSIF